MNYGIVQLWHILWHYGMFSPPHRPLQVTFHRQLLPMSDGGTVALDWTCDLDRVKAASQVEAVQPGLLAQATESRHQIPGTGMPRFFKAVAELVIRSFFGSFSLLLPGDRTNGAVFCTTMIALPEPHSQCR